MNSDITKTWWEVNGETVRSLTIVILVAMVFVWLIYWLFASVSSADNSIKGPLIGAAVALTTIVLAYLERRAKAIKEAHRDKKIEVYSIFNEIVFTALEHEKNNPSVALEDNEFFEEKFKELRRGAIFFGSPAVIKSLSDFMIEAENNENATEAIRRVGRVYLAMRKDIGLSNRGLTDLSIHQLYVNEDLSKMETK